MEITRRRFQFMLGSALTTTAGCATRDAVSVSEDQGEIDDIYDNVFASTEWQSSIINEYNAIKANVDDRFVKMIMDGEDERLVLSSASASLDDARSADPDEAIIAPSGNYELPGNIVKIADYLEADYWRTPETDRFLPAWADNSNAPDYRHLSEFVSPRDEGFELSAGTLRFLADRNAFQIDTKPGYLLFGLRGCTLEEGESTPWTKKARLKLTTPDHINFRCIFGLWRLGTDDVKVFKSSTVPEVEYIYGGLETKGLGVSLLPTGLYNYAVGTHNASRRTRQRGSLLIKDRNYLVLRSPDDLSYDPFQTYEVWTIGGYHNIHSAGRRPSAPAFYSAGCQVLPGGYLGSERLKSNHLWYEMRRDLGIVDAESVVLPNADGRKFQYMLLTGTEAALAYQSSLDFELSYKRVRAGSSGERVKSIQESLFTENNITNATVDGKFGPQTGFAALMSKKRVEGEYTSPITIG